MPRATLLHAVRTTTVIGPLLVLALVLGLVPGLAKVEAMASPTTSETPELVVVLDSSGSMAEADAGAGQTRMDAAKQAVVALAASAPDSARIGLRTYGDGVDSQAPGSCEDTSLKVPVGPVDRQAMTAAVQALSPRGDTPIGTSLRAAAGDLTGAGPRSVVLVSDGEPTCEPDPCVVAAELAALGVDLRVDVVGFRVSDEARTILQCVADAGGGRYVDAADAAELTTALDTSLVSSFRTYVPEGIPISGTPTSEGAPRLEEGQFLDTISVGSTKHYTIDHREGEWLRIGGTIVRADGSRRGVGGFLTLTTSADDVQCITSLNVGGNDQGTSPRSGGLLHGPGRFYDFQEEACSSGPLLVEIEWTNTGDEGALPIELVVDVEPPVLQAPVPQPAVDQAVDYPEPPRATGTPQAVVGAGSFNDAPALGPGLYSDAVRLGETAFYRVPADWGQQVAVRVDFPELVEGTPVDEELGAATYAHLDMFNGGRARIASVSDAARRTDDVDQDGSTLYGTTHPVAFEGREEWVYGELWGMSAPGDVYLVLSLGRSSSTDEPSGVAVPYEVSIDVLGEPLDGPVYATTGASQPPPDETTQTPATPPVSEPAASPAPSPLASTETVASGGDGSSPLLPVLVAVALLLVAALAALVAWGVRAGRRSPG